MPYRSACRISPQPPHDALRRGHELHGTCINIPIFIHPVASVTQLLLDLASSRWQWSLKFWPTCPSMACRCRVPTTTSCSCPATRWVQQSACTAPCRRTVPFSTLHPGRPHPQELTKLISEHLWHEELGTFSNKLSTNNTFYPRITPTSFYPLLAGAASDSQAATIVKEWLLNPKRFCIAPNGDMDGNSDDCFWGLPSINAGTCRVAQGDGWVSAGARVLVHRTSTSH